MRLDHVRPSFIPDSAVVHICPVNGLDLQTGHASVPADMYCCHVSLMLSPDHCSQWLTMSMHYASFAAWH